MSKYRTPWSASSSGALTSDRLKPKPARQQGNNASKGNKKGKDATPKSPRVRELEGILKHLKDSDGNTKDSEGGCFCLARSHALSPYVPICTSCGLILCELNPPSSCCPFASCGAPLLSATARPSLIARVEAEIEDTIQQEIEEEERRREQLKQQEGSFPLLGGSNPSVHPAQKQQPQTFKVLSLNPKTKKATIASYSPRSSTPTTPSPSSSVEVLPQGPPRVAAPAPSQVAPQPDPRRPFMDMRNDTAIRAVYVQAPKAQTKRVDSVDTSQSEGSGRGRGAGGRIVPGAG